MNYFKLTPSVFLATFLLGSVSAQTIIPLSSDRRIDDDSENNTGDIVRNAGDTLMAGDSGDNSRVFATAWRFEITSYATEIDEASSIFFEVELDSILNGAQTVFPSLDLFALNSPGSIDASDYQDSTDLLQTVDMTGYSDGDTLQFDVTTIVKASTNNVGFLLKVQNPVGANNGNSTGDVYIFGTDTGQLSTTTVPEPSTYGLMAGVVALASVVLIRRRRS